MANETSYIIILFFLAFNGLVIATGELGIWNEEIATYNMDDIHNNLSSGVTDLTNVSDLEQGKYVTISFIALPGMMLKAFLLFLYAIAMIPLTGAVMLSYGIDPIICAIFEVPNLLLVAYALIKFVRPGGVTK